MGASSHKWLRIIRRKFLRLSNKDNIIITTLPYTRRNQLEEDDNEATIGSNNEEETTTIAKEDLAAIKIQAYFRGHLARRAYGALRSIVKVQALVRGVFVRKQSHIAMQCMHAILRLQLRVRARQLHLHGTFHNY
ncbi:hypothetical protein HN51_000842 [Arachis hypogaea]|uniref:Protein IQ-DOMAIN n=1 Tax=Arachis hypogaea TaxID=3818 RepID=A0A445EU73_ARAHY|nr:protein IQ-DOMAIN 31-like [Arachis hypogaea]QHO48833.1 Protein IQ-DOMAIN [Arachis hypogaea]RYR79040.1 hypothetical protein Ahy_A01g003913 [Arachis hypogaea]